MEVVCRHISANCNPNPNVLQFLDPDTLVYGFSNQIALYKLSENRVVRTIKDSQGEHRRVKCLAVGHMNGESWIFCGYDSGWLVGYRGHENIWTKLINIKGGVLLSIEKIDIDGQCHLLTNDSDSKIQHFVFQKDTLKCVDQIQFPLNKMIETVCVFVSGQTLMLFLGGVDQCIHYYEKPIDKEVLLEYKFSLSGHENAITKLILTTIGKDELLLASASKDGYIRLWRITNDKDALKFHKNVHKLLDSHYIFLQSVLTSHECSVTNLTWTRFGGQIQLVSCSLDCTLCVWECQEGVWNVGTRLGQFLGNKNAYFDTKTDPHYRFLIALNYTGAVLIWQWSPQRFSLRQSFNGHCDEVRDISWNHSGDFLVSVSKDQTTRVVARNQKDSLFNEISRAQIHGYDINAVTTIKVKDNILDVIACGADEKVIRLIEPPACFANYLNTYTAANLHLFFDSQEEEAKYLTSKPQDKVLTYQAYSQGGTQVLGLMTKVQKVERQKITSYYQQEQATPQQLQAVKKQDFSNTKLDYSKAPHEDYLVKHTLWPQMNKLYGHPHQICQLARSHHFTHLASACKALSKQSASIIVWSIKDWKIVKIIPFHNYTVYALQFSSQDTMMASASKDRKLAVFGKDFQLLYSYEAHSRAVTTLSFHFSQEYILTGSRDKTIKLHSVKEQKSIFELNLKIPISSVAFCNCKEYQNFFVVGSIKGDLWIGQFSDGELSIIGKVREEFGHSAEINSIQWNGKVFASCSDDFSVRIFELP